MGCRT